ncbi:MAG: M14 family metallocarboxypeptidase [Xanthomonadales bacterium]|nr:M14 family metallocarboxypeptidase [Xanthomonadales bacterium]
MTHQTGYPIGTPGVPWTAAERARWLDRQRRQRSYADEVEREIARLGDRFAIESYGEIQHGPARHAVHALRSRTWQPGLPVALVTGGVHGYETSGVHGALAFLRERAGEYAGRANLVVAPCVSPWAYEHIQRWNADAEDPNRSFRIGTAVPEAAALLALATPMQDLLLHIDLHETTDTDESEFRPAVAARDGKAFEPGSIPDGFYTVGDSANPQLEFQRAVIAAVAPVTHIAPPDDKGEIIGSPVVAHGVILYPFKTLGLCAGLSDAPFTTTTEVYPDSPRATPAQCIAAQVAAVCGALDHALASVGRD